MGDVQLLNKDLKCTRKRNRLDSNESKIFSEEIKRFCKFVRKFKWADEGAKGNR